MGIDSNGSPEMSDVRSSSNLTSDIRHLTSFLKVGFLEDAHVGIAASEEPVAWRVDQVFALCRFGGEQWRRFNAPEPKMPQPGLDSLVQNVRHKCTGLPFERQSQSAFQ